MKRVLVVVGALLFSVGSAGAQTVDLSPLGDDFTALMAGLGYDLIPNLEQAALWSQGPGVATLGDSKFYFSTSLGALISGGILTFVDEENSAFELLDVSTLLEQALSGSEQAASVLTTLQGFFPYPTLRAALGFAVGPVEVGLDVSGFPQGLTNAAAGLASRFVGEDSGLEALALSALHLGTRARTSLLDDGGPLPAISIGTGYVISTFNMGYSLGSIDSLPLGAAGDLSLGGDLVLESAIHSFGIDVSASKRLGFFVPFVGVSPWLQLTNYRGGVENFTAVLSDDNPGTDDLEYTDEDPIANIVSADLSMLTTFGFEMFLGRTVIFVHGSYTIGEGSPGVALGTRFQF